MPLTPSARYGLPKRRNYGAPLRGARPQQAYGTPQLRGATPQQSYGTPTTPLMGTPQQAQYGKRTGQLPLRGSPGGARYNDGQPLRTPPPGPTPYPVDPIYNQQIDEVNKNLTGTLSDIHYQQQRLGEDYGFTDPTNPFSRAALLRKHYLQSQSAAKNSMAAQGQLYSGALSNAQGTNTFAFQQGYQGLQKAYGDEFHDTIMRGAKAKDIAINARIQARNEAILRYLASRPDTPLGNPAKKFGGNHPDHHYGGGGGGGKGHQDKLRGAKPGHHYGTPRNPLRGEKPFGHYGKSKHGRKLKARAQYGLGRQNNY